ncbi:MAG TPA: hypothetical protein VJA66_17555 [Thermoanaerobaculia bacterium]
MRGWLTLAAAVLMGAAPAAFAAPGFLRPAGSEQLEPGSTVELLWVLDGLSPDVREAELVLSLDGGRTFPVRVTGDFEPATRRLLWRVPALPTNQARLALRAGADEEPAQEALKIISPAFVISGSVPDSALEELFAVGSEWRTREALDADPRTVPETGVRADSREQIHAGPDREVAAQSGARVALLPDRLPTAAAAAVPSPSERSAEPGVVPRRCSTPLRE